MKIKSLTAVMLLLLASVASADTEVEIQTACSPLFAGQHTVVGTVCIKVNTDDVDVHYLLIDDWVLTEAHAWIGDNLNDMPQTGSGNPKVGRFPHAVSGLSGVADYSFTVPISELTVTAETFCNAEIFVAAHAVVRQGAAAGGKSPKNSGKAGKSDSGSQESAWAGTMELPGGSWASYFSFVNDCGQPEEPADPNWWLPTIDQPGCTNVFASGGTSFVEAGLAAQGSTGWILQTSAGTADYLLTDSIVDYGDIRITALSGQKIALGFFLTDERILGAINVFIGEKGSFSAINPLLYPYKLSGSGGKIISHSASGAELDVVVHAVVCNKGITPPA